MSGLLIAVFSFVTILAAMLGMAVGVFAGRKPISGSCGGLNSQGGCELCSNRDSCPRRASRGRGEPAS